jgi:flagellar hook assembly protein FlgD
VAVVDVNGKEVRILENARKTAGRHSVAWNADDSNGRRVPSGLYFYVLDAGSFHAVGKCTLLK